MAQASCKATNHKKIAYKRKLYISAAGFSGDVGGDRNCSVRQTDSCKFPIEDIMGIQNFNHFSTKFPQNVVYLAPEFLF